MARELPNPRILVVEDETVIAMMLDVWLSDLGCEMVGPASNVTAALALIEKSGIDGAIVDLSLGGDHGYRIADALRQKGIPFAWGTGYRSHDILKDYRHERIIAKPYSFDEFAAVLAGILRTRDVDA